MIAHQRPGITLSSDSGFEGWPAVLRMGVEAEARRSAPHNEAIASLMRVHMHIDTLLRWTRPVEKPAFPRPGYVHEFAVDSLEDSLDAMLAQACEALTEYRRVKRAAIETPAPRP